MAIQLNDNRPASYPIIKNRRIGESCQLAVIRYEQRDRLRTNPVTKDLEKIPNGVDRNGKPKYKQEMVVHALFMGGDMVAAIGDQSGVPAPGDRVRVILQSKAFGNWIDERKRHRNGSLDVGDILAMSTTHGVQYAETGKAKGAELRTQAELDAVPRGVTLGIYGSITLHEGTDPQWIELAEQAYLADQAAQTQANRIPLGAAAGSEEYEDEYAF